MTADIVDSADYSIAIANEENAFTEDVNETVVTLALQSVESTGTKPLAMKNRITLTGKVLRVKVVAARQRCF